MATKFITFFALVAAARSSVVPIAGKNADYTSFTYSVADPISGDYKSQKETRSGGIVQGQYSLLESDGTKRIVDYAADDLNGFNAIVRKDPAVISAAPTVVAARTLAAPAVVAARTLAAPAVYAARNTISPAVYPAALSTYAARTISAPGLIATGPAAYAARDIISPRLVAGETASYAARAINSPAVISSAPVAYGAQTISSPAALSGVVSVASAPAIVTARTYGPTAFSSGLLAPSNYNSALY